MFGRGLHEYWRVKVEVRVKGVHRRTATDDTKECASETCRQRILFGEEYARVLRIDGRIEMLHVECFEYEFGEPLRA